jgi:hypothetical protein
MTLDDSPPPDFHHFECLRRLPLHIAHERRLDLIGVLLHARQQFLQ